MPPELRALQARLQDYILHARAGIEAHIAAGTGVDSQTRLAIYADAYRLRLAETLGHDFPALRRMLGEDEFAQVARCYIDAHPSKHFSVRWFGAGFADFLSRQSLGAQPELAAELARFEWALGLAFDAVDEVAVPVDAAAALPAAAWPTLRLRFLAAMQRLPLHWNAPQLWKTDAPCAPERSAAPVHWLIWRQQLDTRFRSLPEDEAAALATAQEGGDFSELCERLCAFRSAETVPAYAAGLLKRWLHDGLISSLQIA